MSLGHSPRSVHRLLSAAGTSQDATLIRAGVTQLFDVVGYNAAEEARWLKLYSKATAPTSADTPVMSILLPGELAFHLPISGLIFHLGLGYRITTGGADNDANGATAGDILGLNITYRDA